MSRIQWLHAPVTRILASWQWELLVHPRRDQRELEVTRGSIFCGRPQKLQSTLALTPPLTPCRFWDEEEAAIAYDRAAHLLLGTAANLNFEAGTLPEEPWATMHTAILLDQALGCNAPQAVMSAARGEGAPPAVMAVLQVGRRNMGRGGGGE
jgi:hypothetical protein